MTVCEECGGCMTGSESRGRSKKYPFYHHQKQNCIKARFIPKEIFEQLFVEYLESITPNARFEKIFKAVVIDIWKNNYRKLDEELNMGEVLDYCFRFVRNTAKVWMGLEPKFLAGLSFQKRIIIGTGDLSPIYQLNQEYNKQKSSLAARLGSYFELGTL